MTRRDLLRVSIATAAAGGLASTAVQAQQAGAAGGMPSTPIGWKPADAEPQVNDIEKYPKCNYCGMDRNRFHHSRMLIHYSGDTSDAVCSLRCAATGLAINVRSGTKAIWVGDNASPAEVKPLVDAEKATFLVGSGIRGVMTRRSKVAYSTVEAAEAARVANGGELLDFDKALLAAYADIAEAVTMSRKNREERLKRTMQQK
jgi:nitrous oxide reductase accessory protein NosL